MAKKHEEWEARLGTSSFDPLQVMKLSDAVKNRDETVQLGGRNFSLTYRGDRVFYSPVEGYVPCGWIEIDRIVKSGGI